MAKRLAGWLVAVLLVTLPVWAQTGPAPSGSGTAVDPYRIAELGHLVWMSENVAASAGRYYALVNDIDATLTAGWNDAATDAAVLEGFRPIGTQAAPFAGEFDGQGYAIADLVINRPERDAVGLFGWVGSGGVVRRLALAGGSVTGGFYVGGLVGGNEGGTVAQCRASNTVTGSVVAGGLVGYLNQGAVTQSRATGAVAGDADVGGLVGYIEGGEVRQCHAAGAVTGGAVVGGLVGGAYYGSIEQCYAIGMANGGDDVGGLVGYSEGATVAACYATGTVAGNAVLGGLVGANGYDGRVEECYARGAVSGAATVGGLLGWNGGTAVQCYATGPVAGAVDAGGLLGYDADGTVEACYWDTESSGWATSAAGEGHSTAEMQQQGTYADWDFASVWAVAAASNDGYPYLLYVGFWRVRFLAGPNGVVTGETTQRVADGEDARAAFAVPLPGFVFEQWNDGSTENPRTLTAVSSDIELTAIFREAVPMPSFAGAFLAVFGYLEVVRGRGLWDLTGTYVTTVAGAPLTLDLAHDSKGQVTGTGVLDLGPGPKTGLAGNLAVRGTAKGGAGALVLKLRLKGRDRSGLTRVDLVLDLALDAAARQLRGAVAGSLRAAAATTPVSDDVALDLPPDMDGTWTLLLDLASRGRGSSGDAVLGLSNGVAVLLAVAGRSRGEALPLSLRGAPADPAAKGVRMRTTLTPLEGGWARLDACAGTGYGQTLTW